MWDIIENGSDADSIRAGQEITARMLGRPTEHVVTQDGTDPLREAVRAMTSEQRQELIREMNRRIEAEADEAGGDEATGLASH
jgi:hypothetical protein